jgi:hypothetical protein
MATGKAQKKGYSKHKPGRKSHHPVIAFIADVEPELKS